MKRFHSFLLALLTGAALASCSSERYFQFAAHSTGYRPVAVAKPAMTSGPAMISAKPGADSVVIEPVLTASAEPTTITAETTAPPIAPATPRLSQQLTTARAEHQLTRAQERRYERVLRKVQQVEAQHQEASLLEIILCLIPPLAVYVHEQHLTTHFWVSVVLTLLFYVPGVVFALLVVTDTI